jgi:hypothetical protein
MALDSLRITELCQDLLCKYLAKLDTHLICKAQSRNEQIKIISTKYHMS